MRSLFSGENLDPQFSYSHARGPIPLTCVIVNTPAFTLVAKLFATSLAPMPKASKKLQGR